MSSDKTDIVRHIADLARLEFSEHEIGIFSKQFDEMLSYISIIEKLDLENVEPLLHVIQAENVFREDIAKPSLSSTEALANAPKHDNVFFKVPKVLK